MQVSDEFEALKTELCVYCIYGGTPYAPQGINKNFEKINLLSLDKHTVRCQMCF